VPSVVVSAIPSDANVRGSRPRRQGIVTALAIVTSHELECGRNGFGDARSKFGLEDSGERVRPSCQETGWEFGGRGPDLKGKCSWRLAIAGGPGGWIAQSDAAESR